MDRYPYCALTLYGGLTTPLASTYVTERAAPLVGSLGPDQPRRPVGAGEVKGCGASREGLDPAGVPPKRRARALLRSVSFLRGSLRVFSCNDLGWKARIARQAFILDVWFDSVASFRGDVLYSIELFEQKVNCCEG